jgi:site-specific recombinase XerD
LVKDITTDALSTYFQSNPQWSDHTRRSHYAVIRSFLNFSVEEKYLQTNPINALKRPPKPKDNKPGILTIEQTSKLLDAIKRAENEAQQAIGPYVVLALFCGIRAEELDRLTWDLVDEEKQTVEIPEDIAKKHRFRYADIPDNAVMWLRHFGLKATGPIRSKNHRKLVELSRDQAGIKKWPKNAMRHSFASYHFELHGDSKKTSNELGHRGEDLLFSHYRSLTKKGSGSQYFSIFPLKTEAKIVSMPATGF